MRGNAPFGDANRPGVARRTISVGKNFRNELVDEPERECKTRGEEITVALRYE
jgi:hypothetical protein